MKIKKLLCVLLVALSIFALVGCGEKPSTGIPERGNNDIAKLLDQGYEITAESFTEELWCGLLQKDFSFDKVYRIRCELTAELYEKITSLEWDDNYDKNKQAYLTNLTVIANEDIASLVPTESDFAKYIGQKAGILEEEDYYRSGNAIYEDGTVLYYDGPVYYLKVYVEEEVTDWDSYSENDIREFTIKSVEFNNFSQGILEIE